MGLEKKYHHLGNSHLLKATTSWEKLFIDRSRFGFPKRLRSIKTGLQIVINWVKKNIDLQNPWLLTLPESAHREGKNLIIPLY
jgi:hypothetical protein